MSYLLFYIKKYKMFNYFYYLPIYSCKYTFLIGKIIFLISAVIIYSHF